MFHTFQTTSVALRSPSIGEDTKPTRPAGRRISTSNACVECRRRKIRCDGTQPCGQCQWYQHPEACNYSKPAQRVVPSRKLVEKLQSSIEQHQMVMARLFGSKDLESLISLPREELLNLALSQPTAASPTNSTANASVTGRKTLSDGDESLEALEQAPDDGPDFDDLSPIERIQSISDDINGLSMRLDRQPSYVGVSSVSAAMKVIYKAAPVARQYLQSQTSETTMPSRASSPLANLKDPLELPPLEEGNSLIESFFERVHSFFPMLDEETFWQTYLSGVRKDPSWMALLNMVFALGSLASGTSENDRHLIYFTRAKHHITPYDTTFSNPTVEILQALAMMGGYYMHYLNRPNEADALMGATLRVACALGVHREYVEATSPTKTEHRNEDGPPRRIITADVRRRTWWSLFCLDTWATTTTGRPSLGRFSIGVTVREPGRAPENSADPKDPQSLKLLPLIHNTTFCKIATTIQDKLSSSPQIPFDEVVQLDAELVRWWEDLPTSLTTDPEDSIPSFLHVSRLVMKWRYQNLRIILHRPYLLSAALRKTPFASLTAEEKLAIGKCRIIAAKCIEDIAAECKDDVISGWNGVWLAYQAAFVPLVSLFTDSTAPEDAEKWRASINTAIELFSRMNNFSVAAKRSRDVMSRLLDAAKSAAEAADAQRRQQEALMAVVAQRDRERAQQQQEQQQHQKQQQQMHQAQQAYMNGAHHRGNNMEHHSPVHSHPPIEQLAPTNIPHPGMGLPISSVPLGIPLPLSVSTGGGWQEPISAGGMGSTTPQGMPPGGAFWDDMMWESFPPIPEAPTHHQAFGMEGFVDSNGSSWSPHTSDVSSHHGWNGFQQSM